MRSFLNLFLNFFSKNDKYPIYSYINILVFFRFGTSLIIFFSFYYKIPVLKRNCIDIKSTNTVSYPNQFFTHETLLHQIYNTDLLYKWLGFLIILSIAYHITLQNCLFRTCMLTYLWLIREFFDFYYIIDSYRRTMYPQQKLLPCTGIFIKLHSVSILLQKYCEKCITNTKVVVVTHITITIIIK